MNNCSLFFRFVLKYAAGLLCAAATAVLWVAGPRASAGTTVMWQESVNGDLSSNQLAPTQLTPTVPGNNTVTMTSAGSERDFFRFNVPTGYRLASILCTSYTGADGRSFFAVQTGTQMTANLGTGVGLTGYTHFGPSQGNMNTNLEPSMAASTGGFTPPLGAGNYTFWAQQAGSSSTYTITFVIEELPVAPSFSAHPPNRTVNAGGSTTFTVTAAGAPAPTLQWQRSTNGGSSFNNLADIGGYTGSNTATLSLNASVTTAAANGHQFRCVATNSAGNATSSAGILTVNFVVINPVTKNVTADAGSYNITVTSNTDWTVAESLDWLSVAPGNGTGNGTVTVDYLANSATSPRSGNFTVGTQTHTLNQEAAPDFDDWALSLPNAPDRAPTAEPAGDGVPNLMKYALGADDPLADVRAIFPQATREDSAPPKLVFTFRRDTRRTDILYRVRRSTTLEAPLGSWEIIATATNGEAPALAVGGDYNLSETADGATAFMVRLEEPVPADNVRVFYVLEIVQQ